MVAAGVSCFRGLNSRNRSSRFGSGGFETSVVGVLLVEVVIRLWLQLGGQFLQHGGEDGVDGFLVRAGSVPDRYQVGVEADGETDACELIAWWGYVRILLLFTFPLCPFCFSVFLFSSFCFVDRMEREENITHQRPDNSATSPQ